VVAAKGLCTGGFEVVLEAAVRQIGTEFSGTVGVWGKHLSSNEELHVDADAEFESASSIKVLIMAAAFDLVRRGRARLQESLVYERGQFVRGSGILREMTPGARFSLRDIIVLMIAVSDNVATNMLIDRVGGVDAVNTLARRLGLHTTTLLSRLRIGSGARQQGVGRTTAHEMGMLYERLYRGQCIGENEDRAMVDILLRQQYNTLLTRYLPYEILNGDEQPDLRIASKSGTWTGSRCDGGIFFGPHGDWILCVYSGGCTDLRLHVDNEAMVSLPHISRLVWEAWGGLAASSGPPAGASTDDRLGDGGAG